jgi:hypothetical protein
VNNFEEIRIVVLGDSHSVFLGNSHLTVADSLPYKTTLIKFIPGTPQRLIFDFFYLGPQLAYNFLPEDGVNIPNLLGAEVAYFYLGEIDIRVHLARKGNAYETARIYAERVVEFCSKKSVNVQFILPPAPANFGFMDPHFPKVGSLEERRFQHFSFCRSLRESSMLLGLREPVSYDSRYGKEVSREILESDDGCHLNSKANQALMESVVRDVTARYRNTGRKS